MSKHFLSVRLENMKRSICTIIFLSSLGFQLQAQILDVPFQKKVLFSKTTANWCSPCGDYGWIADSIYHTYSDSILFINAHVATSSIGDPYSGNIHNVINNGGGIPAFNVQGVKDQTWAPLITSMLDSAFNELAKPIVGNIAFNASIVGGVLDVQTSVEFFENDEGTFYVNVFIVENNLSCSQNSGNGYFPEIQDRVSRGPMTGGTSGIWGDEIASGVVNAGTTFDVSFSQSLSASWDENELEFIAVLWQEDTAGVFTVVSCEDVEGSYVNLEDNEPIQPTVTIYPNPVSDLLFVKTENGEYLNYTLETVEGKIVQQGTITENEFELSLLNEELGVYTLTLYGAIERHSQKIIKN